MATYTSAASVPTTVAVASTKVYLGTTTTTADNDAFVEIGGVMEIPDFGPKASDVKIQTIGNNLEVTEKGVVTLGGGDLMCVRDYSDQGQTNAIAAQLVQSGNYNLRIVFPNKVTSTGTGTMKDIKVKIMGTQDVTGGPNNPAKLRITLGFNSVPATTAAT
jgi:hypothetical protein